MKYKVAPKVQKLQQKEGISDSELEHMADHAAPYSLEEGVNRRFHQWLFRIKGTEIKDMWLHDMVEVGHAKANGFISEECETCLGAGCYECGWRGLVRRYL